jgi:adenylate cyclase
MAFYGDCVVAVWPPGYCGPDHAAKALAAGRRIAAGLASGPDPVPVGVGVHCGEVFIGTVDAARGLFRDVSIFGIEVTVTARLASLAAAGEVLASGDLARAAGVPPGEVTTRELDLKGLSHPVEAASFR